MSEPRYYIMAFPVDCPRDHEEAVVKALRERCGVQVDTYNPGMTRIADALPARPSIALPHPVASTQPVTTPAAPAAVARPTWADRDPVPARNGNGVKSYDAALQIYWLRNNVSGAGVVDASGATGIIPAGAWRVKVGNTYYAEAARPFLIAQRMQALSKA